MFVEGQRGYLQREYLLTRNLGAGFMTTFVTNL